MKLLCFLIAIAFPTIGFKVGSRWEDANLRMEHVTVHVADQPPLKGTLTRSWNGLYQLQAADGLVHVFQDFKMLDVPSAPGVEPMPFAFISNTWRIGIPLLGMTALGIFLISFLQGKITQQGSPA